MFAHYAETHITNKLFERLKKNQFIDLNICFDSSSEALENFDDLKPVEFFKKIADFAREKSTSISVIGIEGEDCSIEQLGIVADSTGGTVNIVNPLELQRKMRAILDLEKIARNVRTSVLIHPLLKFKLLDSSFRKTSDNLVTIDVGNANEESEVSVEFCQKDAKYKGDENLKLPFQAQIHYTKLDGTKCLRVITKEQMITTDRDKAEKNCSVSVLGSHAVRECAKLAKKGEYRTAKLMLYTTQKLADRVCKQKTATTTQMEEYSAFIASASGLEKELQLYDERSQISTRSDRSAQVLYESMQMSRTNFLSGAAKRERVKKKTKRAFMSKIV